MTTHLQCSPSSTNMHVLCRGIELQKARNTNHPRAVMRNDGNSTVAVVVDGQFDDAVVQERYASQTHTRMQPPTHPIKGVYMNSTPNVVPRTTTTTMAPPIPSLFHYPTIVVLHAALPTTMPATQVPLTHNNMMFLSTAPPSIRSSTIISEPLQPYQYPSFHNGFGIPPLPSNNFHCTEHFAGHRHIPIAPRPATTLETPTALRPVAHTSIPIVVPHSSKLSKNFSTYLKNQASEKQASLTTKKRRASLRTLPTPKKHHPEPNHKKDVSSAIVSSAYGTKLVDRIILEEKDDGKPFHALLSHHPNAALIPLSDIRLYERLPIMKFVPRDDMCVGPVLYPDEIRPPDVLLGRGGTSNRNLGNLYFRQLISYYRDSYNTVRKGQKGQLARNICNYIRLSGGRFLEKRNHTIRNENHWYECGDDRAQAKCAQALREMNLIRCVSSTTDNDNDDDDDDDSRASENGTEGGPKSMGDPTTERINIQGQGELGQLMVPKKNINSHI